MINVEEHLGLVPRIAYKYKDVIGYEEAYQCGCEGLMRASLNYDKEKGAFSTIATFHIEGSIRNYIRDRTNMIKTPRSVRIKGLEIKRLIKEGLTIKQIAKDMEETEFEIDNILGVVEPVYSLDFVVKTSADGEITSLEAFDKGESFEEDLLQDLDLKIAINNLRPLERKVIKYRYFENMTQREVADIIGLSQVQISRYEKRGLQRLKMSLAK